LTVASGRALLVSHHARFIGGGEISLLTLLEGLRVHDWQPTLVVPEEGELSRAADALGVATRYTAMPTLRRPGGSVLRAVRRVRALVTELHPDVVHANGSRAMFYAGLGARAAGCPAIWHLRVIERDPLFDSMLVRLARATIATSEAARTRLQRWPDVFEACRVIPNGIDLRSFRPRQARAEARRSLGYDDDHLVVVSTGRLVDFKRFDLLLDAVARLRPHLPGLRCLIVGDGPAMEALRRRAEQDDLAAAVSFAGRRDDVADLLAAADLFAMTSAVESFGRVLIEAMALSLPVVAPNAGGAAEIVVDGVTGVLVTPARADELAAGIERLCGDAALRQRLGAAGRQRVEQEYSMQIHAARVIALYAELRGAHGAAP
jgi:glycosyltransferase involved in cell wall biosynthesis